MSELHFIDRIQLSLHPEIFIPENVASLPNWNTHKEKDDAVEMTVSYFLCRMSEATYRELESA